MPARKAAKRPGSAPVGIMGGTFDPVHFGHLRLAQEAVEILGLKRVRWVPAGRPWHRAQPKASAKHRLENPGTEPLYVIEVQSGSYLGEDDIERFADDYKRT